MENNPCKDIPDLTSSEDWDTYKFLKAYLDDIGNLEYRPYKWIDTSRKYVMNGTVTIECDCGCVKLEVVKETEDGLTLYYLSAYESSFGARQNKVKQYLTRLWNAVTGKDYHLYELVLTRDEYKKLDF